MQKIPTIFLRDPATNFRTLSREPHPKCDWIFAGDGHPTRKVDGLCILISADGDFEKPGQAWARRQVHDGKRVPPDFEPVEHDDETHKTFGWVPVKEGDPNTALIRETLQRSLFRRGGEPIEPGTYELVGPDVNGNPEAWTTHALIRHGSIPLTNVPLDYGGLADFLALRPGMEGIVWHHPLDGRMGKIKARDFPRG